MEQPLTLHSWPKAIVHIDADAFFASCEQALHPELRGKPVVTGKERGIVAAASYEAKARGIGRGLRLFEVKKICPEAIILPSDYETYSLFSIRMFAILRRFSPDVEEYSIDEAFMDLTGLRRLYQGSYGKIAQQIQETIERELGITVSIGVSVTKVLAKVASQVQKPRGLTVIPGTEIHRFLKDLPIEEVWGIGPNTSALLNKFGIRTALDFAKASEAFVKKYLSKPYQEIWHELNGRSVYPVVPETKSDYQSISKTKTFTPPTDREDFLFAQMARNLENACTKARRYDLAARRLFLYMRRQDFTDFGVEIRLTRPTAYPLELLDVLREGFSQIYRPHTLYRATGVVLSGLVPTESAPFGLFDDRVRIERIAQVYRVIDGLAERFGKHTVHHGASHRVELHAQHEGDRGDIPVRKIALFKGENKRQRLGLPVLSVPV